MAMVVGVDRRFVFHDPLETMQREKEVSSMGRGKIEIKRIENRTSRQVTFSKRRGGLMKKAEELAVLCDAQVGAVVFSYTGKMYEYCTPPVSFQQMIKRYQKYTNAHIEVTNDHQMMQQEMLKLKNEIEKIQLYLRQYMGEDTSALTENDMIEVEKQLQSSLNKVRERKEQLIHQQAENTRRKVQLLEDENSYLSRMHMEHQIGMEHQQAIAEQRMIERFGHPYPEEQPRNLLSLSQFHSFRLQPTQPNLQDASIIGHGLQL